jgi:rhodanese-related sulfurtransferase
VPSSKLVRDVRSSAEVLRSRIPGTINIPIDTLDMSWTELPKDKEKPIARPETGH